MPEIELVPLVAKPTCEGEPVKPCELEADWKTIEEVDPETVDCIDQTKGTQLLELATFGIDVAKTVAPDNPVEGV